MCLLLLIMALRTPIDSDMWWHLRAGEETVTARSPYLVDTLSHTRTGENWINHSWMSQIIMYGILQVGGIPGIALWVGLTVVLTFLIVYFQSSGSDLMKVFVIFLAAAVSSPLWSPRPQLFSLLMFSVFNYLLSSFKSERNKKIYFIVPLFVVWTNLHGGYVLGFMLLGTYLVGEVIDLIFDSKIDKVFSLRNVKTLAGWGLLSWFAVLINPNGLGMWKIPFQTVGVETLQQFIAEWASPDFHQPLQQLFLLLMFTAFGAIGFSRKRLSGQEFMSVAIFGAAALIARRNVGPFAIVVVPVICRHGQDLQELVISRAKESESWFWILLNFQEKSERDINPILQSTINWLVIGLLVFASGAKLVNVIDPVFVQDAMRTYYPVDAVAWIEENQPEGKMLNSYNWGGYLVWHLRDYPVFVDGRTDLYGDEILEDWLAVVQGQGQWKQLLSNNDVNLILLENNQNLRDVYIQSNWSIGYQDELSMVLVR
jgi:hypothetical protein